MSTHNDDEPQVSDGEDTTTIAYSNKVNPANVSVDLNAWASNIMEMDLSLDAVGFAGKGSANLISVYGTDDYTTTITWTTDGDGYVTGYVAERSYDYNDEVSTDTVTVTYKN